MLARLQHAVHSSRFFRVMASSQTAAGQTPQARSISRQYPDEPRVGVGVVVFRHPSLTQATGPQVLLIQRGKEPAKGQWCFPGGSLELGETIAACAVREVLEETGVHLQHIPSSTFLSSTTTTSSSSTTSTAAPTASPSQEAVAPSPAASAGGVGPSVDAGPDKLSTSQSQSQSATSAADQEQRLPLCRQPLLHPAAFAAVDSLVRDTQDNLKYHYAIIEVAAVAAADASEPTAADDVDDVAWVPLGQLPTWPSLVPSCAELAAEAAERFDLAPATAPIS